MILTDFVGQTINSFMEGLDDNQENRVQQNFLGSKAFPTSIATWWICLIVTNTRAFFGAFCKIRTIMESMPGALRELSSSIACLISLGVQAFDGPVICPYWFGNYLLSLIIKVEHFFEVRGKSVISKRHCPGPLWRPDIESNFDSNVLLSTSAI